MRFVPESPARPELPRFAATLGPGVLSPYVVAQAAVVSQGSVYNRRLYTFTDEAVEVGRQLLTSYLDWLSCLKGLASKACPYASASHLQRFATRYLIFEGLWITQNEAHHRDAVRASGYPWRMSAAVALT